MGSQRVPLSEKKNQSLQGNEKSDSFNFNIELGKRFLLASPIQQHKYSHMIKISKSHRLHETLQLYYSELQFYFV